MIPGVLGIDTGGTFTDFVLLQGDQLQVHKVLSTPHAPQQAILQGIQEMGLTRTMARGQLVIIHGTTVATNAVLQGKGVKTACITNRGLKDVLIIGRQTRQSLYDLTPAPNSTPWQDDLMLEVDARLDATGQVLCDLTEADLQRIDARLDDLQPEAIAINLLFSYLNDRHERQLKARYDSRFFVSRSSEILPEQREYERGVTTWLNAWVGPLIKDYLESLSHSVSPAPLAIMQSNGLTISAERAAFRAVNLLLSGPAGGLAAALHIGMQTGRKQLMTFDMGGTSTDVALLEGEIRLTNQGRIGAYPVAVPMADIHTIGAGGGSIASIDAGGLLQVGPQSAGAVPGPACYGKGGILPTVTDANLVLGRLQAGAFLGGRMTLDMDAARQALAPLAEQLKMTHLALAEGIIALANAHMAQALRVTSVQKGFDPRDFVLTCFGGAGGLHVCDLAEALEIPEALIPINGGVLSAQGMLTATPGRELIQTRTGLLAAMGDASLREGFAELLSQAQDELRREGVLDTHHRDYVALRYQGQTYPIVVPYTDCYQAIEHFHRAHQQAYGHCLEKPVELIAIRVHVAADRPPTTLPGPAAVAETGPMDPVNLVGEAQPVPVFRRESLNQDTKLTGPALLLEAHTTTFVKAGWHGQIDAAGNLILRRSSTHSESSG